MKLKLMLCLSLLLAFAPVDAQLLHHRRKAFRGGGAFVAPSVTFDGSGSMRFTSSAVTMSGTGKAITICFWVNFDSLSADQMIIMGRNGTSGAPWKIYLVGGFSGLSIRLFNSSSTEVVNFGSNFVFTASAWHHVMIAVNTATSTAQLYMDGANQLGDVNIMTANELLALDRSDIYVASDDDISLRLSGCLAQLWVDDSFIDLSNSTNRAKFISGGHPVDLGSTGATPTGSSPDLFMKFVTGSLGVNSGADGGTASTSGGVAAGDCGTP